MIANQLISENQLLCFDTHTTADLKTAVSPVTADRNQFLASFSSMDTLVRVAAGGAKWQAAALTRPEQSDSDHGTEIFVEPTSGCH